MSKSARVTTVYLYGDGHAVEVWELTHAKSGEILRWVEIHQQWGPKVQFPAPTGCIGAALQYGAGRLIISCRYEQGLYHLLKKATYVAAKTPSTDQGTQKTKALGLEVGLVEVGTTKGSIAFHVMPGIISSSFDFQEDVTETWSDTVTRDRWNDYKIAARHPSEKEKAAQQEGVKS